MANQLFFFFFCKNNLKMKKLLFTVLTIANSSFIFAQNALEKTAKISIGIQGIEANYELPITKEIIWENSLGMGVGMNAYNNGSEFNLNIPNASPFVSSGLKWMYNYEKRVANSKDTQHNSANYLGLQTKFSFGNNNSNVSQNQALLTDIHWGLQRNLGSKFTINTNIGLGYLQDFEFNDGAIAPILRVKFAYRIF